VNVGTVFAFLLVSGGVIILRRTRPDLPRASRAPLLPLLPIASVCACVWLIINLPIVT
jgi:APA family basic amino acid/polyamine antiporter